MKSVFSEYANWYVFEKHAETLRYAVLRSPPFFVLRLRLADRCWYAMQNAKQQQML